MHLLQKDIAPRFVNASYTPVFVSYLLFKIPFFAGLVWL
jgi:hypothetical protein